MAKYIFVTGGVVSSLGKGIASASIGLLLKARGLRVTLMKLDPYINVDPGTMSPYQHGEVYVTEDGAETDLDLGHYERFTGQTMTKANNVTAGRIYFSVIEKERRGDYLGGTVQVVPHVTDEIKRAMREVAKRDEVDVVIIEVGGTVGDIEGLPFLEAIRQLRNELGRNNALNIHLTLVPYIRAADELKTKPTQHSVGKLREIGIQADVLLCRTERPFSDTVRGKIAQFCNVEPDAVIQALDVRDVYEVPLMLRGQGLDDTVLRMLDLSCPPDDLAEWRADVVGRALHPARSVRIAVVGKYIQLQDAYKSIYEALRHGGLAHDAEVVIKRVDSELLSQQDPHEVLHDVQGVLIPGGFGHRGIKGKLEAIRYARQRQLPFLGICLGMQCAVIEFARNVCGLEGANSTEFDPATPHPVVSLLAEQRGVTAMGATMRLGASRCRLREGTKARACYGTSEIHERHRHRYEVNNHYREQFTRAGLVVSGTYEPGDLVELIELTDHPWFIASQFHPEFKSRPGVPHPLFHGFVGACLAQQPGGAPRRARSAAGRSEANATRARNPKRRPAATRGGSRRRAATGVDAKRAAKGVDARRAATRRAGVSPPKDGGHPGGTRVT
ncbi:MAG TPA: CTP synthase [bacterium]